MKYIKLIFKISLFISLIITITLSAFYYSKIIQTKDNYQKYLNEKANIEFTVNIVEKKFDTNEQFGKIEDYVKESNEIIDIYQKLSNESLIQELDIPYYISIGSGNLMNHERLYEDENVIIEGRNFTNEELENGANVVILHDKGRYRYRTSNEPLKVGDKILIHPPYIDEFTELSKFEVEVIGFYKSESSSLHKVFDSSSENIYMSSVAVKNQSEKWIQELFNAGITRSREARLRFVMPIARCENELEYDKIQEIVKHYGVALDREIFTKRLDTHEIPEYKFNTKKFEQNLTITTISSILISICFIPIEIISGIKKKKEQQEFNEIMLKEQEKNVQNIMNLNQDTRKLKHDLKHIFAQLTSYAQNDEKDKILELLDEYKQEINDLEIPAYTQNGVVDMVINYYLMKSKKMNIDFSYSGTSVSSLNIKDRKLYLLLSNALENAFVHCDNRKTVRFEVGFVEPYCRFVITNTIASKTIQAKDENHGYGLPSMKAIIDEVNGILTTEVSEDKYTCILLIPIGG